MKFLKSESSQITVQCKCMFNSLSPLIHLQDDVQRVQEVFPHTPVKEIRRLVMEKGVCEAIYFLCEEEDPSMQPGEPTLSAHQSLHLFNPTYLVL